MSLCQCIRQIEPAHDTVRPGDRVASKQGNAQSPACCKIQITSQTKALSRVFTNFTNNIEDNETLSKIVVKVLDKAPPVAVTIHNLSLH